MKEYETSCPGICYLGISFGQEAKLASFLCVCTCVCVCVCVYACTYQYRSSLGAPFLPDSPQAAGNAAHDCSPMEELLLHSGALTLWG